MGSSASHQKCVAGRFGVCYVMNGESVSWDRHAIGHLVLHCGQAETSPHPHQIRQALNRTSYLANARTIWAEQYCLPIYSAYHAHAEVLVDGETRWSHNPTYTVTVSH